MGARHNQGNVLLVDIETIDQQLAMSITSLGYTVIETTLSQCNEHMNSSLIIVDAKAHGYHIVSELTYKLKRSSSLLSSTFPIIAIVDIGDANKHKLFQHGAVDYLSSPLIVPELKNRLSLILSKPTSKTEIANHSSFFSNYNRQLNKGRVLVDNREYHLAEQTAHHLKSRLSQTLNLEKIAKEMGTNRNKLSKVFKAYFGMTLFRWVREQRLMLACSLLQSTFLSIQKISEQVGYPDSNNFSTTFKREFNLSPYQYRQKNNSSVESKDYCAVNKD